MKIFGHSIAVLYITDSTAPAKWIHCDEGPES